MRRRIIGTGLSTLCLIALAACSSNGSVKADPVAGPSVTSSPSPSPSPSNVPMPTPSTAPPTTPASLPPITHGPITLPTASASTGNVTISGTVQAGAEPMCLTVTDGGKQYLLLTKPNVIYEGDVVKATGHVVSGTMTHCMRGIPFEVTRINVLSSDH